MKQFLKEAFRYRELLGELVRRDLRVKYRRSILGYLWSLLNPLLMMTVISLVFSYMFRFDIENYPLYLLTGQTLFNFFSESANMAMISIINGSSLIRKVYLPKQIFPISKVLSCFVNFLFSFGAIVIMMAVTRTPVRPTVILLPFLLAYVLVFSIGVGLILSIMATYFRDVVHLWGVFIMAWMYLTPIFYPVTQLPHFARRLMAFNPMFHMVEVFRWIVLYGKMPSLKSHCICLIWALAVFCLGVYVFRRKQNNLILYL